MLTSGDLSLYFHIPFCSKKCPYCHFYVVKDNNLLKKRFLDSLKKEWAQKLPLLKGRKIVSIYFGGGTPSLLTVDEFEQIFALFDFPLSDIEITMEANPDNIHHLKELRALGINRLSLGVQSLDDQLLKKLGRTHDAKKALAAIGEAVAASFHNISIDLMYDLPGQTLFSFEQTLNQVLSLPITHLSLYNLTIEPHTLFFRQKEKLQKEMAQQEESLDLLKLALNRLGTKFNRYEISAFAVDGLHSCHNSGYWVGRDFLGFGPSAFSYFGKERFSNLSNILLYEKKTESGIDPCDFKETLSSEDRFKELLAIRLRYFSPFSLTEIDGIMPASIPHLLTNLITEGYIQQSNNQISLTEKGALFYDSIAETII